MKGLFGAIEKIAEENDDFRYVRSTAEYLQLVLMSLKPSEEIGDEDHKSRDQSFRVEKSKAPTN